MHEEKGKYSVSAPELMTIASHDAQRHQPDQRRERAPVRDVGPVERRLFGVRQSGRQDTINLPSNSVAEESNG
jgi:hypothetical protein